MNAKQIVDPILSVFGCEDGGIAFARLSKSVLPEMIERAKNGDAKAAEFVRMVTQFSNLCTFMLKS